MKLKAKAMLLAVFLTACGSDGLQSNSDGSPADLSSISDAGQRDLTTVADSSASTDLSGPTGRDCNPQGNCPGPLCNGICCGSGEWCDGNACRCGQSAACGTEICSTGGPVHVGEDRCGGTCCGGAQHPCPL